MQSKLDYNSEEVMRILNNPEYTDEQKKTFFEKYKSDLKQKRKLEIKNRVNELAKKLPVITEEIYINFLKKYEDDNLTKPFNVIEKEIKDFEAEMTEKYNDYINNQKIENEKVEEPKEEIKEEPEEVPVEEPDPVPDVTVTTDIGNPLEEMREENNVLNEEPEDVKQPLVDDLKAKDVMPDNSLNEKGNASAIIISIITVIIGIIAMYTIIKLS